MTCEEFEEYITDYLEGALAADHYAAVETHRAACESCRSLTAMVAQILDTCHAMPKVDLRNDLVARILRQTTRPSARRLSFLDRWREWFRPVPWPKAAIGTALMIGFLSVSLNFLGAAAKPREGSWWRKVDLWANQLYSQGLKVYDRTNQWRAQLRFFGATLSNRVKYHWEEVGEDSESEAPVKKENPPPPAGPQTGPEKRGAGGMRGDRTKVT